MQIVNKTGNTVYVDELDINIPYSETNNSIFISADNLKKSKALQQMIIDGLFEVFSFDDTERIECNIVKLKKEKEGKIDDVVTESCRSMEFDSDLGVTIKGHFFEAGGYAKVNRNLAYGLNDLGIKVSIDPLRSINNDLKKNELEKLSLFLSGKNKVPLISIDSMIPTFGQESHSRYKILYTTIESYTIPQQFIDTANIYNEIWVVSDFCKEVLDRYDIKPPVYVMPNTVDVNNYTLDGDEYSFNPPLNSFIFISVFGWSYRKGYDVLLKSYLKEFSKKDNVTLLLLSRNSMGQKDVVKQEVQKFIDEYGGEDSPRVVRCSKIIPEQDMPAIYRSSNAFVLFSRGEAWGLPYTEASLCGLPVIGTKCSGQTMFLNNDNSYLLDIDQLETIPTGTMHIHYWDNQEFPALKSDESIRKAGKLMREVYENYDAAKTKNEKLRENIIKNYNINNVMKKIGKRLMTIKEKIC